MQEVNIQAKIFDPKFSHFLDHSVSSIISVIY